jgi:hypothetical protein
MKLLLLPSRRTIQIGLRAGAIGSVGIIFILAIIARIALAPFPDLEGFRSRFRELTIQTFLMGCCAILVWLFVHVFNQGEQARARATRMLVAVVGLATLYLLSFGPACWITSRLGVTSWFLADLYRPIVSVMWGPNVHSTLGVAVDKYSRLAAADGWQWMRVDYFCADPAPTQYTWVKW